MNIESMIGKTFVSVEGSVGDGDLIFIADDGMKFVFNHHQDCCEGVVSIDDITGDLQDLVGEPLLVAEESTSNENPVGVEKEYQDSFTWTFYKFATRKGYVDVRWYGESNGYYSESVDLDIYDSKGEHIHGKWF